MQCLESRTPATGRLEREERRGAWRPPDCGCTSLRSHSRARPREWRAARSAPAVFSERICESC